MKNFQTILLLLLTAAVAVLFVLQFSGKKSPVETVKRTSTDNGTVVPSEQLHVAYIDLDTIQKYYEYFKLKNADIERDKQRIENQIQAELNKLEKDRIEFLKKGQAITQLEAEKFQQEYRHVTNR